ncbi:transmembrane protease serine 12-like isoform X2 [Lacerta agilis]|uniref:transmembrane protease serine 12-like isoform X2 n=1 Tax=Lacerta agilis TaxID=80427 RepID=UPI001419E232|nr:transmembrane protease serine 12-like isoform X2 [Lacerta agilis]
MLRKLHRAATASLLALLGLLNTPRNVTSLLPMEDCGKRPLMDEKETESRIIGGHDAMVGSWPWNAAFWRAVIAVHHLHIQNVYTRKRRVSTITIHSDYDSERYEHDIALFTLIKHLKYNNYIQPICLPENDTIDMYPCFIAGWGNTKEKGVGNLILQEAQVDIFPLRLCNRYDSYAGKLTKNMLCAGSLTGRVDSCQGDSGGPLMCYFRNVTRYYLIGITSFGFGCGRPRYPGIYVRTVNYRNWIDTHLIAKTTNVSIRWVPICWLVAWTVFYIL